MNVKAFILCGGSGTRLWPLSRENYPKQFLDILNDGKSLFQKTVLRSKTITTEGNIIIITNEKYYWIVLSQLEEIGVKDTKVIREPLSKNTAPAIALGLRETKEEDIVLVLPSDQYLKEDDLFSEIVNRLKDFLEKNDYIFTFGIVPAYPETGYGYIEIDDILEENVYKVRAFKEKPSFDKAKEFVESKKFLWNSGMFLFRAKTMKEELKTLEPSVYQIIEESSLEKAYENAKEISIDYAVMEKTKKLLCLKLNITWSDVGSWKSVYDNSDKDENDNVIKGDIISLNSRGNLAISKTRLIATYGVKDLIIIDTEDVALIMSKENAQEVKKIFNILKEKNDKRAKEHITTYKPYGYYTLLEETKEFRIRKLVLKPKKSISYQRHFHRTEHWIVLKGTAKVLLEDKEYFYHEGESFFVPKSCWHKVENPGLIDLEMLEVQAGSYLGENDIEIR